METLQHYTEYGLSKKNIFLVIIKSTYGKLIPYKIFHINTPSIAIRSCVRTLICNFFQHGIFLQ